MRVLRAVLAFWWDFVVGDDWLVAVAVAMGLALTWAMSRLTASSWWVLPVVVSGALALSVRRVVVRSRQRRNERPAENGSQTGHSPRRPS
jgi:hypothetical protein